MISSITAERHADQGRDLTDMKRGFTVAVRIHNGQAAMFSYYREPRAFASTYRQILNSVKIL
jgi:hypothetical protein